MDRGLRVYFAIALGFTWALQAPALLAKWGVLAGPVEQYVPLAALGGFGPLIAALVAASLPGGGGNKALFARFAIRGFSPLWHVLALVLPAALLAASMGVVAALGIQNGPYVLLPEGQRIAAAFVVPFVEEVGWRGFALPRLIDRYGAHRASAILGVLWALWHLEMLILQGLTAGDIAWTALFLIAGSYVFTWIFQKTRTSLLSAFLLHVGAHLANSQLPLPGDTTPMIAHTVAFTVLALVIVIRDPSGWRRPSNGPAAHGT